LREAWTAEAVHNVSVPAARRAAAGDADELFAHARPPTKRARREAGERRAEQHQGWADAPKEKRRRAAEERTAARPGGAAGAARGGRHHGVAGRRAEAVSSRSGSRVSGSLSSCSRAASRLPCFFSCRVCDVCFFFLAPAEWGWLTRQRSCSGRLGQGESPEVEGDEGGGRLSCSPLTSCWWQNPLVPWQPRTVS
jgi:ParB-like chromosome segregation protein Spo0J